MQTWLGRVGLWLRRMCWVHTEQRRAQSLAFFEEKLSGNQAALTCLFFLSLLNPVLSNRQSLESSREQGMRRRKRRSDGDCGRLQPTPVHSSTCWPSVQLPRRLIGQQRCQIVIFPRLWPFCVFEIVLWVFGLEGGLAGRPEPPLLSSRAASVSVALVAWVVRTPSSCHHHCCLVLCGPGGQRGRLWEPQRYQRSNSVLVGA